MLTMEKTCNGILEAGIAFLLILSPIYYGSATILTSGIIELAILIMLIIWVSYAMLSHRFYFRRTPLDIPILLFCIYTAISTFLLSKYKYASYVEFYFVVCVSALYFLIVNHIRSEKQIMRMSLVIIITGFIHAFYHLIQNVSGIFGSSTNAVFNIGNHFAAYMVIILPLALAISLIIRDMGKRIIFMFICIVMFSALAFSLNTGAMLASIISILIVVSPINKSVNPKKRTFVLAGFVLCAVLVILWIGYKPVLRELSTITNLRTGSLAKRLSLWKSSLYMFADNPVSGTGLGTFDHIYPKYRLPDMYGKAVYAHNDWLQLLTELGIIGFLMAIVSLVVLAFSIRNRYPFPELKTNWIKGLIVGGVGSIAAGSIHALVDFNFHIPAIAILFVSIIALTISGILPLRKNGMVFAITSTKGQLKSIALRVAILISILLTGTFIGISVVQICIAESYHKRGLKLENTLQWDKACENYRHAMDWSRSNSHYPYALGNVYAKRARLTVGMETHDKWNKLAVKIYKKAISLCPTNGDYHLALGNIYETSKRPIDAENAYLKSIFLDPNNAFYHRIYADFCVAQCRFEEAIKQYTKAIEIYPDDLKSILNECYGNIMLQEERVRKQLFLKIAHVICPETTESIKTLAQFCEGNLWYESAIAEYKKLAGLLPEDAEVKNRLSYLMVKTGRFDDAISMWREFQKNHPESGENHAHLASIYAKQKLFDNAIQEYISAVECAGYNDKPKYLILAADLYMRQGKTDEAERLLQNALEWNPHESSVYYRLGCYYEESGKWLDALDSYHKAIQYDPKNVKYRSRLAKSYFNKGMLYETAQELEQALEINPRDVSINLQLSELYKQMERDDKSEKLY
jgi:tetratricopeptide (TPR) repeat protein/O-antigen ligase